MPPKKRKSLVERLEEQRLLWFILISILIHHTVLTVFFKPPAEPEEETLYKIVELEPSSPEPEDPAAAAQMVPVIPRLVVSADKLVPDEKKKAEDLQQTVKEEEKKKPEEEEKPKEVETAPAEVIPTQGLHYVDIKSNESDKPPEKAKYFAPINSIVDKETRAENTNLDHDDGMSTPQQSDFMEDEKAGDADRSIAAHQLEEDKTVEQEKGNENKEAPVEEAQTPQPSSSAEEPKKQEAQAEVPEQKILVVPTPLTVDNAPEPSLEKTEDGEIIDPETGQPILSMSQFFNVTKKKQKKVEGSESTGDGAGKEMDLPWKKFEGLFAKQMAEEKKAFEEAKKSHQKGGFTKKIDKVMSQLENFTADVQPGNQTALNAAYHPFAEYITAFHRKLHPQWGDGYLASLYGMSPTHPHNNMDLVVKLEFVVNEDGTVDKATVVKSSGDLAFDVAAIDAVYGGEPYPAPPEIIKSYNGKVYLRWSFYRNESQCGPWNSEPYIIPAPAAPVLKPKKTPGEVKPKKK